MSSSSKVRRIDHIDLRVPDLEAVRPFYQRLLPALGFSKDVSEGGWLQYAADVWPSAPDFFGVVESPGYVANETRIAFWADSPEEVDQLAEVARSAGALHVEGPGYDEGPGYYAVFFEDPCGNRLEICHREARDGTEYSS